MAVYTVERQHAIIVRSEKHRAMVQSRGAACHHLGQPTTIKPGASIAVTTSVASHAGISIPLLRQ